MPGLIPYEVLDRLALTNPHAYGSSATAAGSDNRWHAEGVYDDKTDTLAVALVETDDDEQHQFAYTFAPDEAIKLAHSLLLMALSPVQT